MHENATGIIQQEIQKLLAALGEAPLRSGLLDTPKRVAKAYVDCVAGYEETTAGTIGDAVFEEPLVTKGNGGVVIVRNIDFASTCEATLMPFHGQCHVAYVPSVEAVLGLSKLARLVNVLSKRLSSQQGLADALVAAVGACMPVKGVLALVSARHLARALEPGYTLATASSGCFAKAESAEREEAVLLLQMAGVQLPSSPFEGPSAGPSLPSSLPVVALSRDLASMTAAVQRIYACVLPAQQGVRAAAAAAYVDLLEQQTIGYRSSLELVRAKHAQCSSGLGASDGESPSISNQTAVCKADADAGDLPGSLRADAGAACAPDEPLLCGVMTARDGVLFGEEEGVLSRASHETSCSSSMDCGYSSDSGSEVPALGSKRACGGLQGRVRCSHVAVAGVPRTCAWHVSFASQCEHHLLPFYGRLCIVVAATVQPSPGLLQDVVDLYSCRLQIQERITHEVADAIVAIVPGCLGVLVVGDAVHMCMVARGVEKHASSTVSTAARGLFVERTDAIRLVLRQLVLTEHSPCAHHAV